MKQLIKIEARYLKIGDLVFDFKTRECKKVQLIQHIYKDEIMRDELKELYVDFEDKGNYFPPNSSVLILIDTEQIEIIDFEG